MIVSDRETMMIDGEEFTGELLDDYAGPLERGYYLAVMPISRVHVGGFPKVYPFGITFYPEGQVNLDALCIKPNDPDSKGITEKVSALSGIDQEVLDAHPLIVFPLTFNWSDFRRGNFRAYLDYIQRLSDYVDKSCLNFIRYLQCPLDLVDCLPGRAGTINSNRMMSGALLYNHSLRESRIIGGDAFSHTFTKGLGLPIDSVDSHLFPRPGEVGSIVGHALSLYTTLLEANSPTMRFVQALSLLEFLAYPDEYKRFEDVKKVIARYVAKTPAEYQKLLERFFELTAKKDVTTGKVLGYRTRVVHMGHRIEDIVANNDDGKRLFEELETYIKAVIDHLIKHSDLTWEQYLVVRDGLKPFQS